MRNLGTAQVKVEILNKLPGIREYIRKLNFDISAKTVSQSTQGNLLIPPLLVDYFEDRDGQKFATCIPSRRKLYIDNLLTFDEAEYEENASSGEVDEDNENVNEEDFNNNINNLNIVWKPTQTQTPHVRTLLEDFDNYFLLSDSQYVNSQFYNGPQFSTNELAKISQNDVDKKVIRDYLEYLRSGSVPESAEEEVDESENSVAETQEEPKTTWLFQTKVKDGLWWGIESDPFLFQDMPLWVHLNRRMSPSTTNNATFYVLSFGIDDSKYKFDIVIRLGAKLQLIEYVDVNDVPTDSDNPPDVVIGEDGAQLVKFVHEWQNQNQIIPDNILDFNIGIMAVAGRISIDINGSLYVYESIYRENNDKAGTLKPMHIPKGKMRIYGTNCQTLINVSPMVFAPLAILPVEVAPIYNNPDEEPGFYQGVNNRNQIVEGQSVCILPKPENRKSIRYGCDCFAFTDETGTIRPNGEEFQSRGFIKFGPINKQYRSIANANYYAILMKPSATKIKNVTIPYGGCPFFFNLKGAYEDPPDDITPTITDVSEYVKSVSEKANAPDFTYIKKTATITLYNHDVLTNLPVFDILRRTQLGVRISWGWNEGVDGSETVLARSFVGVVVSSSTNETPGHEEITLNCEDYIHILEKMPITNSPFYDGMIMSYAIRDLANRAGIATFVPDWTDEDNYFLPSGYVFSEPRMRFDASTPIFECMKEMLQLGEAFVYFDGDGRLYIKKVPGGIWSEIVEDPQIEFTRNPAGQNVIINEKSVDYNFDSTVNAIYITSVDRDTRNLLVTQKQARGDQNNIIFYKRSFIDKPSLGKIEVARAWMEEIAQRVFYPIKQMSFETVGVRTLVLPLSFVLVDGQEFRVMSIERKFDAENNTYTNSYEASWLGGQQE